MAVPRFLVPHLSETPERLELPRDEAHHAARVLRLPVGAPVVLFDGDGLECLARVDSLEGGVVTCLREAVGRASNEPPRPVTLVQATLAGSGMDAVVRDATMLGVHAIDVVSAARSQLPMRAVTQRKLVERWQRVAVASAKQCGRARVPTIRCWATMAEAITAPRAGLRLVLVEPSFGAPRTAPPFEMSATAAPTHVLVGPEGGWTPDEMEAIDRAGWSPWRLGPLTLRADAAGAAALAVLQCLASLPTVPRVMRGQV